MGKYAQHLGEGEDWKVGEKTYKIQQLGTEDIPEFFKFAKIMGKVTQSGNQEEDAKSILSALDDESLTSLKNLINKTLAVSFPEDWEKPEEQDELKRLGLKHMDTLMGIIMKINSNQGTENIGEAKKNKILDRINNG